MEAISFKEYRKAMQDNFETITKDATHLFEVEVDKDEMWNLYLDSFSLEFNQIFRERRAHDCSCCRNFIRNMGATVAIVNNEIQTIWGFNTNDLEYQPVLIVMDEYIKSRTITNVFVTKDKKIGIDQNREQTEGGEVYTWNHLNLSIPLRFVDRSSRSIGDLQGTLKSSRDVFASSLEQISEESILTVLELIASNSIYKGVESKDLLEAFLVIKRDYEALNGDLERSNFTWVQSTKIGGGMARIKNTSIGTLLLNITEGMGLDTAVSKFEAMVAPENYKRTSAIFTKRMIEDAKKKVSELGYENSMAGRFASLEDITVNNVLFSNKDSAKRMQGFDVFDEMKEEVAVNPKNFSSIERVTIDNFIENILPTAKEVEVLLENKHAKNMASIIAPLDKDAKSMLKWNNNFRWCYEGNLSDSSMKDRVEKAGGSVTGDLRYSIQWNDMGDDCHDLDAHCVELTRGDRYEIYYGNKGKLSSNRGVLDVDIQRPRANTPAVENITYANRRDMRDGTYTFYAKDYSGRGFANGFRAEIEFDGQIFSFDIPKVNSGAKVEVATVSLKDGVFTIKQKIDSTTSSREIWGLKSNNFVPVSVVMNSPNYWDGQEGVGNKHYMFMLKGCENPSSVNAFFNEYLDEALRPHRKVFEALGSKMAVQPTDNQLSGLGFSSTQRNEVIVKVTGQVQRVVKVTF